MTEGATPDSGAGRLALALADPYHLFTRAQVAYLMAEASRWGREAAAGDLAYAYAMGAGAERRRLTELNLAAIRSAIATPTFSAASTARDIAARAAREAADAASRALQEGDHLGGPVADWDYGPEAAQRAEEVTARLATLPRVPSPGRVMT